MAYDVDFLSDVLRVASVTLDLRRNDETSGSGSGRFWAAELARPLWQANIVLAARYAEQARGIDAKVRALGPNGTLLFADPAYRGPAQDLGGAGLAEAEPIIRGITSDRTQIRLEGLPQGYKLTAGDRLSIQWGAPPGRWYLADLIGDTTAGEGGISSVVPVYPYVPLGISAGAAVELIKPVVEMRVGAHAPFETVPGFIATEAHLTLIQKV